MAVVVALCAVSCGNGENNSPIPVSVVLEYSATPYGGEGMKNLVLRNGTDAELYGIADTVKGRLTDAEMQALATALKTVTVWDTTYEETPTSNYEMIRKIHTEGMSTIRRSRGATAPDAVNTLLQQCGDIARRLRAEAENGKP